MLIIGHLGLSIIDGNFATKLAAVSQLEVDSSRGLSAT